MQRAAITAEGTNRFLRQTGVWPRLGLLAAALLAQVVAVRAAPEPWVSQTGLTASQLTDRIQTWNPAPYRLSPVCLSGYEEAGQTRYAALWAAREDSDGRRVVVGLTAGAMTATNTFLQALGYRLIWLNGFETGGTDYYSAIYRRSSGSTQVLRLGDSLSAHQSAHASLVDQGHYLENLTAFQSGLSPRYAAWWIRATVSPLTDVSYGLTPTEYQTEFNNRAGTWRLHNVCGYRNSLLSADRFTVIWRRPARSDGWAAVHGLSKANYFAVQGNQTMVGRRPVFQHAWAAGPEVHFNGIWVDNGGLNGRWLDELDRAVASHMETNEIPGLTLAVSRRGKLVFARGYGWADREAGELAGPDHRFRVASVSKPICSVSVLHTLEHFPGRTLGSRMFGGNGIFGSDYGTAPYSAREQAITLRHLLNHTAGWPNDGKLWWHDEPAWGSEHAPVIDYQLNSVTQTSDPGAIGRYSNLGYVIAARVVEKLSGRTFEDYTRNEVMAACGIEGVLRPAVGGRTRAEQQFMEAAYYPSAGFNGDPYLIDPRRMDGSTAWIARPSDLLLLGRRVDGNATHTDILSADSIDDLHTPGSPSSSSGYGFRTYGLGWYTDDIANPGYWGHNGGMAGTRAEFILRTDGTSYAWMANTPEGNLNGTIESWARRVTTAAAWPDIDLFASAHPAYDAWADTHFSNLDRGQPGLRPLIYGPDADPDQDRIPNAGEAYLGLDPNEPNASPFSVARVNGNLRVRWQRSTTERGVKAQVQISSNLESWFIPINVPIVNRPDLVSQIGRSYQEVLLPMTAHHQFLRLRFVTH